MKIKEVTEKTGLTDKAIRLYINEGLAAPSIEENHSGRKSIKFSESDVERLNNVAMLRKAGFPIADIKSIVENKETKAIIEKYIGETETEIGYKTEIVEKLKSISFDEEVTLETICNTLSATVEETEVPSEDLNLNFNEVVRKAASIIFAASLLLFSVAFLLMVCITIFDFRYIRFDMTAAAILSVHSCWLILIALSVIILWRNTGKRFIKNIREKTKGITAGLVVVSIIGCALLTPVSFGLMIFGTPFYSQTTDIENYLKFDESLEGYFNLDYNDSGIYSVFPRRVPENAKITSVYPYNPEVPDTTKYYYNFTSCPDGSYGTYDISAEWVLPSDEYERAKNALPGDFLLDEYIFFVSQMETSEELKEYLTERRKETNTYEIVSENDWTIIFYEKDDKHYKYLIAAYNDKECKMRYISSDRCGHEVPPESPYYMTLDWK